LPGEIERDPGAASGASCGQIVGLLLFAVSDAPSRAEDRGRIAPHPGRYLGAAAALPVRRQQMLGNQIAVEFVPQGTFVERIRAAAAVSEAS